MARGAPGELPAVQRPGSSDESGHSESAIDCGSGAAGARRANANACLPAGSGNPAASGRLGDVDLVRALLAAGCGQRSVRMARVRMGRTVDRAAYAVAETDL